MENNPFFSLGYALRCRLPDSRQRTHAPPRASVTHGATPGIACRLGTPPAARRLGAGRRSVCGRRTAVFQWTGELLVPVNRDGDESVVVLRGKDQPS